MAARACCGAVRALEMAVRACRAAARALEMDVRACLVAARAFEMAARAYHGLPQCCQSARNSRSSIVLRHTGSKIALDVAFEIVVQRISARIREILLNYTLLRSTTIRPEVPQEAHPLRVERCASDLWLWSHWALSRGPWSRCAVVSARVARWSFGFHAVGSVQVARCEDVIFQSCTLRDTVVVRKLFFRSCATVVRCAWCCGE